MRSVPVQYVPTPYYYHANQQWDLSVPRQYPPVDTGQLENSVTRFQELIKEADLLIDRLANSTEFANGTYECGSIFQQRKSHCN